MLRYSRLLFKTKYHALPKDAPSISSMLSCMFWMESVPVTRLACIGDSPGTAEYWVRRLTSKGLSGLLDGNVSASGYYSWQDRPLFNIQRILFSRFLNLR